jgi:hypothetical protein
MQAPGRMQAHIMLEDSGGDPLHRVEEKPHQ